jgi:alanyl-tRNA synthetase
MEQKWPSEKVRQAFVDYFVQKRNHTHIVSSPVVPYNDPTLLFTNAGMNQFKPIFLGTVDPKSSFATLKAAVNSQKCIRAGGKHNDLDDVGKDTYHHTFFEMLGNWSFGDYFQEEAISWAWELLTEVYGLDKEKLYVTYFKGDKDDGLQPDLEAKRIWGKFLPDSRILPYGKKENFWEMGETGPCGPCSEIHYDRIGGRDASQLVNADDPTVIEIWNLVFIQFNREPSGKLRELPNKHVDTGMGFERLTGILQNKMSNYDSDVFTVLFENIQKLTGAEPYTGKVGEEDVDLKDMAYRVIADHIRTLTIALTDGATPGPTGRGYVLRRILRRAVRFGKEKLKAPDNFFHKLVDIVIEKLGDAFPELRTNPKKVRDTIQLEEVYFQKSFDKGVQKYSQVIKKLLPGDYIPLADSLLLATTYGFDIELQKLMAEENKLKVYETEFKAEWEARKDKQREKTNKEGEVVTLTLDANAVNALSTKGIAGTNDLHKYQLGDVEAHVKAIWTGLDTQYQDTFSDTSKPCGLVLDNSNFYAESGGQMFDIGLISNDKFKFVVDNVQSYGAYILHTGTLESGTISVGDSALLQVDVDRRRPTMANHTSTHLVNFALRKVVGDGCDQKGSVVNQNRFRFDFSHNKALSEAELKHLDDIVTDQISRELPVYTQSVPLALAKSISGLRAMFGEKYPDPVRVISVGADIDEILKAPLDAKWRDFSIEFCGGTHLSNTREAQAFTIVQEEPSAQGVRRIVAVTGEEARTAHSVADQLEERCKALEKLATENIGQMKTQLFTFIEELDKSVIPYYRKLALRNRTAKLQQVAQSEFKGAVDAQKQSSQSLVDNVLKQFEESKDDTLLYIARMEVGGNGEVLHNTCKAIIAGKPTDKPKAVLLFSVDLSKPEKPAVLLCAHVNAAGNAKGLLAKDWAGAVAPVIGGKAGGKPDTAQGRGTLPDKVDEAIKTATELAKKHF